MTVDSRLRSAAIDTNRRIVGLTPRARRSRGWVRALASSVALLAIAVVALSQLGGATPRSMAQHGIKVEAEMGPTAALSADNVATELLSIDGTAISDLDITAMKADDSGTLWLTVRDAWREGEEPPPSRLYGFDGVDWWRLDSPYRIAGGVVAGNSDVLWVNMYEGLASFDGETWVLHETAEGAPQHAHSGVFDARGDVWLYSNGMVVSESLEDQRYWALPPQVSRFDGSSWTYWRPTTANEWHLGFVAVDEESVWIATQADWSDAVPGGTSITTELGLDDRSPAGIWTLDDDTWTLVWESEHPNTDFFMAMAIDANSTVWAAYRDTVLRLDGTDVGFFDASDGVGRIGNAVINYTPADLVVRGSEIWVGTGGGGLSRYDGSSWQTFGEDDGLPDRYVFDIEVGPGDALWLRLGSEGAQVVVFEP